MKKLADSEPLRSDCTRAFSTSKSAFHRCYMYIGVYIHIYIYILLLLFPPLYGPINHSADNFALIAVYLFVAVARGCNFYTNKDVYALKSLHIYIRYNFLRVADVYIRKKKGTMCFAEDVPQGIYRR